MFDKLTSLGQKLSPGMRKIAGNVGWLFIERILTMAITFAVGISVIRYLGSENFGNLSYSVSFVALFGSVATLGLRPIVVRNIVRQESATNEILGTAVVLRLLGAAIAIIGIAVTIFAFNQNPQTRWLTIIISLPILFISVDNTIELWFQSQVLAGKVSIVKIFQIIFASVTRLILIWQKFPLVAFAWTLVATSAVKTIGTILIYSRQGKSLRQWQISPTKGREMLSDS